MANCKELREIAKSRLKASEILMKHNDYDGAAYIMGYALECGLKAVICKRLNLSQYPDKNGNKDKESIFKTHNLDILLTLSGLENDFSLTSPARRSENWSDATKWTTDLRYAPIGTRKKLDVQRMHQALTELPDGVLTWITKHRKW